MCRWRRRWLWGVEGEAFKTYSDVVLGVRMVRIVSGVPVGSIVSRIGGELEASRCFGEIWRV